MKRITTLLLMVVLTAGNSCFAQQKEDNLLWSATNKLTADDFQIKKAEGNAVASYAQFSITYKATGKALFSKNMNKRVYNYFIRSASWIDTTKTLSQSLQYQQTLFDLCEVYVRQFRQALSEYQGVKSLKVVDGLNETYTAAFSKRRLLYDKETNFGTIGEMQEKWELVIKEELNALNDFAFEK